MIKKYRVFLVLICVVYVSSILYGQPFPKHTGKSVNDFVQVISPTYEQRIEALAVEVFQKTGVAMVVATVEDLGRSAVEDYASKLYETWGIGQKGKDNGVLFLLAMRERKVRIEVGYGLEGILPDGLCGEILDHYAIPDFKSGNYGRGFYRSALAVADVVAKDAGVAITGYQRVARSSRTSGRERGGGLFFIILFILLMIVTRGRILPWIFLGMLMGGGRGGGFGGGRGFGGGFGGFGGGMSGGGGASRGF